MGFFLYKATSYGINNEEVNENGLISASNYIDAMTVINDMYEDTLIKVDYLEHVSPDAYLDLNEEEFEMMRKVCERVIW